MSRWWRRWWPVGIAAFGLLPMIILIAVADRSTPPPPPALPFPTPYRVFRLGGERIGPWFVCGEHVDVEGDGWGSEGQRCVRVTKNFRGSTQIRAIACGTQVYAVDTGQPCGQ